MQDLGFLTHFQLEHPHLLVSSSNVLLQFPLPVLLFVRKMGHDEFIGEHDD